MMIHFFLCKIFKNKAKNGNYSDMSACKCPTVEARTKIKNGPDLLMFSRTVEKESFELNTDLLQAGVSTVNDPTGLVNSWL